MDRVDVTAIAGVSAVDHGIAATHDTASGTDTWYINGLTFAAETWKANPKVLGEKRVVSGYC